MNINKKEAFNLKISHVILGILFMAYLTIFFFGVKPKFSINFLRDSFVPGAGFFGPVPQHVIDMHIIVNRLGIKNVALGGRLLEDPFLQQRAFEYLYPVRIDQNSADIFFISVDPKKENCDFVQSERAVELFHCK